MLWCVISYVECSIEARIVSYGDSATSFISQSNTQAAIADAIWDLILSNELKTCDGLRRHDLASTLGASIIRIREDMRQLQAECPVIVHRRPGTLHQDALMSPCRGTVSTWTIARSFDGIIWAQPVK
jgi:DNA-binding FadR family transcriptional regulator